MFCVGANGTLEAGMRHGGWSGEPTGGIQRNSFTTVVSKDMNRPTRLWGRLWSLQTASIPVTKWQHICVTCLGSGLM